MEIFPAIDLKGGRVVRLTQGDYDREDVYSDDPVRAALSFKDKGAKNLHVVDLDGARDGALVNFPVIGEIAKKTGLFVQTGGGIRDAERVERYLAAGVSRVILGTAAVEDFELLRGLLRDYGEKIAVGVDARDEKVAVRGWLKTTDINSVEFCKTLSDEGVKTIIYTDIARDGAMSGSNLEVYGRLAGILDSNVVASGGISSLSELAALKASGVYGAIVGKAIYQGLLDIGEVLAAC